MFHSELNNFVVKFHQLWQAGFNAHLNVDSHAGYAWCGLRVDLGPAPAPPRHPQQHQVRPGGRRHAPSYRRRLEARAAARAAKEAEEATAAETAEEAATAKKAAEDAAAAQRVTEAVIAVGTGVAATAKKIAKKAEAAKNAAEEATETAVSDENVKEAEPNFEFSVPIVEEASTEKETLAEEAKDVKENENIVRSEERMSVGAFLEGVQEIYPSSIMKVPSGYPAPEWFCDLLGTRQHHGNVKFLMTPALQTMLGHHADYVITHYQFVKRLWAYMSYQPLNKDEFIATDRCVPVFGSGVKKWSDIKKYLGEHVFFRSSRVGVFSGKKC